MPAVTGFATSIRCMWQNSGIPAFVVVSDELPRWQATRCLGYLFSPSCPIDVPVHRHLLNCYNLVPLAVVEVDCRWVRLITGVMTYYVLSTMALTNSLATMPLKRKARHRNMWQSSMSCRQWSALTCSLSTCWETEQNSMSCTVSTTLIALTCWLCTSYVTSIVYTYMYLCNRFPTTCALLVHRWSSKHSANSLVDCCLWSLNGHHTWTICSLTNLQLIFPDSRFMEQNQHKTMLLFASITRHQSGGVRCSNSQPLRR